MANWNTSIPEQKEILHQKSIFTSTCIIYVPYSDFRIPFSGRLTTSIPAAWDWTVRSWGRCPLCTLWAHPAGECREPRQPSGSAGCCCSWRCWPPVPLLLRSNYTFWLRCSVLCPVLLPEPREHRSSHYALSEIEKKICHFKVSVYIVNSFGTKLPKIAYCSSAKPF